MSFSIRPGRIAAPAVALFVLAASVTAQDGGLARIKDIAVVRGVRENQLVGVGLVTGLAGKGDSTNSAITKRSVANLLDAFGLSFDPEEIRAKNAAVVTVTATIPAFSAPGDHVSVHVASLGDATDLLGGILLQTNLRAANGNTYAVAQGVIATDATEGSGRTVGTIPRGAIIERAVSSDLFRDRTLVLVLNRPDFSTAFAVSEAVKSAFSDAEVRAINAAVIEVRPSEEYDGELVSLISAVEQLSVRPDVPARVVVNQRAGVVVLGGNVRIGPVGISYRNNDLKVRPARVYGERKETSFVIERSAGVSDFVLLLQDLGVDTDTVIEILKLIDKAGALYGTLVVE